jgi:hypothetical protein
MRWNSAPWGESSAKILPELGNHEYWDILCSNAFWTIRSGTFWSCETYSLIVWFLGLLAGHMKFRLVEGF